MCHDFVAQVEVFYFSPKSDAFSVENRSIQYIVKKMKINVLHYTLFHMFLFSWNWKYFHRIALNRYFGILATVFR